MEGKKLFLLDAYALIFRAYHAMKYSARFTSHGMNTSAIFGFVNTLEEILRKESPTHIAVCFDPAGKTFRHELFPDYKAGREATPEDIKTAVPYIKKIIRAYRIPIMEVEGYEADDVIGTLAVKSRGHGFTTYIMSPDKDLGQLAGEGIKIYRPGYKGQDAEIRSADDICRIYGIERPEQIIDMLALMGDKVDNIAGCPGVGEKTASKLIMEFGSVENLVANTAKLKGSIKEKVEANIDSILFSKKLATIRTDVPVEFDEKELERKDIDAASIRSIFEELEFRSLLKRVLKDEPLPKHAKQPAKAPAMPSLFDDLTEQEPEESATKQLPEGIFHIVTAERFGELVDEALAEKKCGIFVAATNKEAMRAVLKGIAVSVSGDGAFYLPFPETAEACAEFSKQAKRLLESGILKIGNDIKHAMIVLRRYGIEFSEPFYDNTIAHYLLQPEMGHSTDRLSEIYLNEALPTVAMPQGVVKSKFDPAELPVDDYYALACSHARANLLLYPVLNKQLEKNEMQHLLNDIEFPLTEVLADMEMTGVTIDVPTLKAYSQVLTEKMNAIERECFDLAGMEFNVSSPAQVGEVLFGKLKIDEKAKKTVRGQYSTTEEVLEKLTSRHPLVGKILEFRKLKKLLSTYVNALPELINPETGKIHTTFNQTVTATGRLSSTNPNLQNIPIRNDEGREIRKAFIPGKGNVFFSADYSQIELRIVANASKDKAMVEAFLAGEDIHRATAAKIFHEGISEVTDDQRRKAKTANFGMIYGISAFGLSERLQIPRSEAKSIITGYFETFPDVKKFMDESIAHTKETGYVTTLFGRRRIIPDINSKNAVVRGYAERNAINAPIQGTAADIIKIAMVRIFGRFKKEGLRSKMILQVHDELDFDVVPEELDIVARIVKEEMEGAYKSTVPLIADCGAGENWLAAH